MNLKYDRYNRLEVAQPYSNLAKGFRAEIHDPVFFLAMQWLMGEFQGEDASSPVHVAFRKSQDPIDPIDGNADYDPRNTPPEAILESEPGDWWTPGRRVRIGLTSAAFLPTLDSADPALLLSDLPAPYHHLNGRGYDGYHVFLQRADLGLEGSPIFSEVPDDDPADLWDPSQMHYNATFTGGGINLRMQRHSGGHVDWYSVDADGPLQAPSTSPPPQTLLASRLRYPGSPNPRWWEIEDQKVDIAGFPPDRGHFATMLLIDLIATHSDDWFTFPIEADAGNIITLHEVTVTDSFDDSWVVTPPPSWHLFRIHGMADDSIIVWPTVTTPLTGQPLEEVLLGIDEDANLLFAVERRINGRDVLTKGPEDSKHHDSPLGQVDASQRKSYTYRPSINAQPHWHPYTLSEVDSQLYFIQARLADLSVSPPQLMPEPLAELLLDPDAGPADPVHKILPAAIPHLGIKVEKRWILARKTDRSPILWMQRHRLPLRTPPALGQQFDVAEEKLS